MRPRWTTRILARIRTLVGEGRVHFTLKALRELVTLHLSPDDACDVLLRLSPRDVRARARSERTGEWMYVFQPRVMGDRLYVKAIIRSDCVVISFHEDESDEEDP